MQSLVEKRIIRVDRRGMPFKNWYWINYAKVTPLFLREQEEGEAPLTRKRGVHWPRNLVNSDSGTRSIATQKLGHELALGISLEVEAKPKDSVPAGRSQGKSSSPPSGRKGRDPRTDHPAIVSVREVSGRFPPKTSGTADVWDLIIKALGDSPDEKLLRKCCEVWLARGFRPTNWAWALDWYPAGGPPVNGSNGSARKQNGSNRFSNSPEHTADGVERLRQRKKTILYTDREGEGA
jgi:hypothetical protein